MMDQAVEATTPKQSGKTYWHWRPRKWTKHGRTWRSNPNVHEYRLDPASPDTYKRLQDTTIILVQSMRRKPRPSKHAPTTFPKFLNLPLEIRARIWELTIFPRIVDVRLPDRYPAENFLPICRTPIPAALQACQESRRELSRYYQRAFSELQSPGDASERYVWVNFDVDIIDVGKERSCDVYAPVAHLIKRLRFDYDGFEESSEGCLKRFASVEEVFVVCEYYPTRWVGYLRSYWGFWPCGEVNVWMVDMEDGMMLRTGEFFGLIKKIEWDRLGEGED